MRNREREWIMDVRSKLNVQNTVYNKLEVMVFALPKRKTAYPILTMIWGLLTLLASPPLSLSFSLTHSLTHSLYLYIYIYGYMVEVDF